MEKAFYKVPSKQYADGDTVRIQFSDPVFPNLPMIINKIFIFSSAFSAKELELFNSSQSFIKRLPYLFLDYPVHLLYRFNETIQNGIVPDLGKTGDHPGVLGSGSNQPLITSEYLSFSGTEYLESLNQLKLPLTKTIGLWIYLDGKSSFTTRIFSLNGEKTLEYLRIVVTDGFIESIYMFLNGWSWIWGISIDEKNKWFPIYMTEGVTIDFANRLTGMGIGYSAITYSHAISNYDTYELKTLRIGENFMGKIRNVQIWPVCYYHNIKLIPGMLLDHVDFSYCTGPTYLSLEATCKSDCGFGSYIDLNTNACVLCIDNCIQCTDSTSCQTCANGYSVYINSESITSCVTMCPEGYFDVGGICGPCVSDFSTCISSTQCSLCSSGFTLLNSEHCLSCVDHCAVCDSSGCSACEANYYLVTNGGITTCSKCLSNCYFCYNSTNCDECFEDFYKVTFENTTDACVETCPEYFYPTELMICEHCMELCINCTNSTHCNECEDEQFLHTYVENSTQVCLHGCPEYYYESSNKTCEMCPTNCLECNDYDYCTSCISHYIPELQENGTKICMEIICEFNQYFFNENCYYCMDNCSSCTSSENCSACGNSTFLMHFSNNSYSCLEDCPDYYYKNLTTIECHSCLNNCKNCFNDSHCSKCQEEYYLFHSDNLSFYSCSTDCPIISYYKSSNYTCEHCLTNCLSCENATSCDLCFSGFYRFISPNLSVQCLDTCPESTFIDSNLYCINCSANCQNCTNLTNCEGCKTSYFLLNYSNGTNSCLSVCPEGYYSEDGLTCTLCSDFCTSCSSWISCESCNDSYYLISNTSNEAYCFDTCYIGNYIDEENNCLPCPIGCDDCVNSTLCRLCHIPDYLPILYLDGSIICSTYTPLGYYSNGSAYLPCDFRCMSCSNSSNMGCNECDYTQSGVTQINGICECQSGYYANTQKRICETCEDPLCESCNSNNFAECFHCSSSISGLYLDSSTKTCKCSEGKYRQNNQCYSCHSFCKSCTGPTSSQCEASQCSPNSYPLASNLQTCLYMCKSGDDSKYFDITAKQCKNCIAPCKSCSEASVCLSCISKYYLFNGECLSQCPTKYFFEDQTCYPCDSKCKSCTTRSTYCISSCEKPYFFLNHACLSQCPEGYTGVNQQCHSCCSGCNKCTMNMDNSTTCTECSSEKFLYQGSCVDICPSGYYGLSSICKPCNLACTVCFGATYKECQECNSTLGYIKLSENTCAFPSCLEGYYYNSSFLKCTMCPETCVKCINSTFCTGCVRGYSLNRVGVCCNDCDKIGFYRDEATFECMEICGDGRNMGMYDCDDGNLKDGDGCSSKCEVEDYFKCLNGDSTHPDECTETKPPKFMKFKYFKNLSAILQFQEPVLFQESVEKLFRLSVQGDTLVSFSVNKLSNRMLRFDLNLNISLEGGEKLILESLFNSKIVDYSGNCLQDSRITSTMYKYIPDTETASAESSGKASLYVMLPSLALSLGLSLVFNTPIEGMWATISIIQMLSYMTLLKLNYPQNLLTFFEYIESVHDFNKWMPNPFQYIFDSSKLFPGAYSDQFSGRGFASCYLVFLCGADLTMLLLMCLAILFLILLFFIVSFFRIRNSFGVWEGHSELLSASWFSGTFPNSGKSGGTSNSSFFFSRSARSLGSRLLLSQPLIC